MASLEGETEIFPSSLELLQRHQPARPDPNEPPPFSSSSPPAVVGTVAELALAEGIRNVALEGAGDEASEEKDGNLDDRGEKSHYPFGIYAGDCHFYLRNGWCKFGMNCRFSHPVKRTGMGESQGFVEQQEKGEILQPTKQIECKYYSTAGGCKYGEACRFSHSKERIEISGEPQLNFLGLPIRLGKAECPFYMRNGTCRYGLDCRFHHPDPTTVGDFSPDETSANLAPVGREQKYPKESPMGNPDHLRYNGILQEYLASRSLNAASGTQPCWENGLSPVPGTSLSSQKALAYPQERAGHRNGLQPPEEYPQRPFQPECAYFMKTGHCKYGHACKFHHPKHRVSTVPSYFQIDKALPVRSDRRTCRNYTQFGFCKYGSACFFDHPVPEDSGSSSFGIAPLGDPPAWS
ncbi:zinc finger CCCH domain-containing protein 67-like isoform X2 [Rhodamnia argentea]|uniref:Zinc finger CCCH domain-containing protein 67-like isoform X2 n=1 Tax=Rhodamnia argentea TaxID=178133 RepID=A0A8B8QCA0_9MYRT|nr:zinc finger CCCH domain-containing protein 67-like isoform X2 [Rhodamnia argentea]